MHKEQIDFCKRIKNRFPDYFKECYVLDVGSLDINGNNRYLFDTCNYIGLDIVKGKNVDTIQYIHKFEIMGKFDTIICTEMLEHDKYIYLSLRRMIELLKPGGLLLITAATTGRKEHGTIGHGANQSPGTNDYYKNVDVSEFLSYVIHDEFKEFGIEINQYSKDIYFYGVKL